jgi:hypothetical protein
MAGKRIHGLEELHQTDIGLLTWHIHKMILDGWEGDL